MQQRMSLTCTGSHRAGLLHIAFNQDNSCIAIGTSEGIRIYHIDTHQICYRDDIGAVGCAQLSHGVTKYLLARSSMCHGAI